MWDTGLNMENRQKEITTTAILNFDWDLRLSHWNCCFDHTLSKFLCQEVSQRTWLSPCKMSSEKPSEYWHRYTLQHLLCMNVSFPFSPAKHDEERRKNKKYSWFTRRKWSSTHRKTFQHCVRWGFHAGLWRVTTLIVKGFSLDFLSFLFLRMIRNKKAIHTVNDLTINLLTNLRSWLLVSLPWVFGRFLLGWNSRETKWLSSTKRTVQHRLGFVSLDYLLLETLIELSSPSWTYLSYGSLLLRHFYSFQKRRV